MRYPLTILLLVLTLIGCMSEDSKEFTRVTIEPVYLDSLSIRAIEPLDADRVWFAANAGRVGLIDKGVPKLATIKYQDSLLNFRSVAATSEAAFVLSIGSPAVLYRIGFDGVEATSIEEVYVESGEGVFYDAMAFWNDLEGIAMGDPVDGCLSIILTSDGGKSWSKVKCTEIPPIKEGEAAFAASNSNIALYGQQAWIVTGGNHARVFHSPDKGSSWEVFDTPIVQGGAMTGIYSVDFRDGQNGIIFGGDWEQKNGNTANKAISSDGGKTWKLVSDGMGPGYRSSVRYVPGTEGRGIVALGSPGISYSTDGGEGWIELSDEGFYALEFVNDSLAFASGRNRIVKLKFE
ncbi:oxidoreductase [Aureitalea marina]|uniref:Oxidoreductase n=1 Tax=Aureitalea marina TaxID=930804 RepID=A0A2S7KPV5_9FLAO|nr:oxidoreductase [Aureitalea marina]PQB04603.1 oxidoreductase [Aureitalea marina]